MFFDAFFETFIGAPYLVYDGFVCRLVQSVDGSSYSPFFNLRADVEKYAQWLNYNDRLDVTIWLLHAPIGKSTNFLLVCIV